ncbi:hypothetical protein V865_007057 [Kwoniella europaea PYCC6329]|uniref:Uncharacterized protein n=1 Tax=Kwoniella europaea PYCC6329 TaxID=1423913 RepID=A0AAX4KRD0_9TREE
MDKYDDISTTDSHRTIQLDAETKKDEEQSDVQVNSQSIISSVRDTTNSLLSTTGSTLSTLIDAHKKLADSFKLPEMRSRRSQVVHSAAAATVAAASAALAYKYGSDFCNQSSNAA